MINICFEQGDKHKVCGRMKNMKKIALAIAATSILGVSASTQAAIDVCVFDLLGKSGESYKMIYEKTGISRATYFRLKKQTQSA